MNVLKFYVKKLFRMIIQIYKILIVSLRFHLSKELVNIGTITSDQHKNSGEKTTYI